MVTDAEVLAFFSNELSVPLTWKFKEIPLDLDTPLQDYAGNDELIYAIEDYSNFFGVDISHIDFSRYFPLEVVPFIKRVIMSRKQKLSLISTRRPLTVRMFVESAKAGRWLYD
ncbi:DUF1493 family protein [Yersinia intermedia]|uniref:DUF1493 family protein n=1 Tax=Yersinia intermedia TaxID=631 RepID=UPI0005E56C60|nr:DUF1493 family protein [Yersinia intermedia]MDN0113254.1 DUF1493 family protein [Yersinia intermedia]CNE22583.1 Protein of uncharacterised function (DUF1493) [Yersinia intermedia]